MPLWRRRQQAHAPAVPPPPVSSAAPARQPSPNEPIGARQRWQVERLKVAADQGREQAERDPAGDRRREVIWLRGIFAATQWALGELESAPISGTYTGLGVVPDIDLMEEEDDQAEWALRHPRETGHSSKYANGVQHTMMWIVGDTDDSPIGFEGSTEVIPGQR